MSDNEGQRDGEPELNEEDNDNNTDEHKSTNGAGNTDSNRMDEEERKHVDEGGDDCRSRRSDSVHSGENMGSDAGDDEIDNREQHFMIYCNKVTGFATICASQVAQVAGTPKLQEALTFAKTKAKTFRVFFCVPAAESFCGSARASFEPLESSSAAGSDVDMTSAIKLQLSDVAMCHVPFDITTGITTTDEGVDVNVAALHEHHALLLDDDGAVPCIAIDSVAGDALQRIVAEAPKEETVEALTEAIEKAEELKPADGQAEDADSRPSKQRKTEKAASRKDEIRRVVAEREQSQNSASGSGSGDQGTTLRFAQRVVHQRHVFWGADNDGYPPSELNNCADFSYEQYEARFKAAREKRYREMLEMQRQGKEIPGLSMMLSMVEHARAVKGGSSDSSARGGANSGNMNRGPPTQNGGVGHPQQQGYSGGMGMGMGGPGMGMHGPGMGGPGMGMGGPGMGMGHPQQQGYGGGPPGMGMGGPGMGMHGMGMGHPQQQGYSGGMGMGGPGMGMGGPGMGMGMGGPGMGMGHPQQQGYGGGPPGMGMGMGGGYRM